MKFRFLFILLAPFVTSCTQLTNGDTVSIVLNSYAPNGNSQVISLANRFFVNASYNCRKGKRNNIELICSKETKAFFSLHTISEVIEISSSPVAWQYINMKQTRWDTGIIDSDLLTDTYQNKDIKEFCGYMDSRKIATCR